MVAASLCGPAQAHGATLFENGTAGSANFALFPFWQKVLADAPVADEATDSASGCIEDRHCAPREWLAFLAAQKNLTRRAQLDAINQWANARPYVEDWVNWQVGDYWETPGEFIARGGDCEDFAIAKYFSLVRLGFPVRNLRILVASDTRTHGFHAVLAVRLNGTVWLLDNFLPAVVPLVSQPQYVPVYSLNSEGWWMHSNPVIQLAGIAITTDPIDSMRPRLARD